MPILFTCPHCGLQTNVAEEFAGRSGPCARCGKPVTVPAPQYTAPPPRASGSSSWLIILLIILGGAVMCCGLGVPLLLPAVQSAREAARRAQCSNNLKQIAVALHNYHDVYKKLPPAVVTDKQGRAIRSWRVALLPFVDQSGLYQQYDFNQPWDSPKNSAVGACSIPIYRCPSDRQSSPTQASYVMVVGEGTLGGKPNEFLSFASVPDGMSNTIAVVELSGAGIPWNEPRDITVDELLRRVAARKVSDHPSGFNVVMADGAVRFIDYTIDPETLRALLIRNDGKATPNF